jgi:cytochrome c peroxidase
LLGGNSFKKLGAVHPVADANDLGRMNLTSNPEDRLVFKVPGLRNVALTAPYFHDGSQDTLEDTVRAMGRLQLPRKIGPEDVRLITAFLKTLSDPQRVSPGTGK